MISDGEAGRGPRSYRCRNRFGGIPEDRWPRQQQVNHSSLEMDPGTSFCWAASLLFVSVLAWRLRRGCATEICSAAAMASLYWLLPPLVLGLLLLVYSTVLVWDTNRWSELLPVKNRAVLVTGSAPPPPRPYLCFLLEPEPADWTRFWFQPSPADWTRFWFFFLCSQVVILGLDTRWRGG